MSGEDRIGGAVASGVTASEEDFTALLRSIVQVARAIFSARASSILLHDTETDELVFAAVADESADDLEGQRFPAARGVAGWVLNAAQPLVIDDVAQDPRFAADVAEGTGFVPKGLMAVPLLREDRVLGVLEVLDRPQRSAFSLVETNLLSMFAEQASIAIALMLAARHARVVMEGTDPELAAVARVAAALDGLEGERREAGTRLLEALEEVLRSS